MLEGQDSKGGADVHYGLHPHFTPSQINNDSRKLNISCVSIDRDTAALKLILFLGMSSVISIPILFWADKIVHKIGRVNVLAMSFIIYCIRFIAYSYLTNAWWCLPFEAMEAFTYQLMWTASTTYSSILAPQGLLATLSGLLGVLHFRLGQGCGSFIGGYLIGLIQVRQSFWYFGITAAIFGVVYFVLNYAWLQKLVNKRNSKTADMH